MRDLAHASNGCMLLRTELSSPDVSPSMDRERTQWIHHLQWIHHKEQAKGLRELDNTVPPQSPTGSIAPTFQLYQVSAAPMFGGSQNWQGRLGFAHKWQIDHILYIPSSWIDLLGTWSSGYYPMTAIPWNSHENKPRLLFTMTVLGIKCPILLPAETWA